MKTIVILIAFLSSIAHSLEFTGKAYDQEKGQLLYIEKHKTVDDSSGFNQLIETQYTDPDGKVMATIRSDFKKDLVIPDVIFVDTRFGFKDEQVYDPETKLVKIVRTNDKNGKTEKNEFKAKKNMLGGQGFNNFLVKNFDQLLDKKSIPVQFIVLSSRDFFEFKIQLSGNKKLEPDQVEFGLSISSYFLKVFVSDIQTIYSKTTKRLLTFKGLSNLSNEKGKPYNVRIEYEYPAK